MAIARTAKFLFHRELEGDRINLLRKWFGCLGSNGVGEGVSFDRILVWASNS